MINVIFTQFALAVVTFTFLSFELSFFIEGEVSAFG